MTRLAGGLSDEERALGTVSSTILELNERRVDIDWQEMEGERFTVRLALEGNDRRGLYADIATAVSATGTDIRSMELRTVDGRATGAAFVEVENLAHLEKIIKAVRRVKGITEVARRERISAEE